MPSLRNWRKKRVTESNDKKVPALRFKGFTDDWEQRKLGEVLLVNSGKDYKNLNKGNIPVYGTGGYMLSVNRALSNENAIGIGRKGTIDRPQYLIAPFWTVDTLFFLTVKNQNDLKFFYALFQKINWKKYDESTGLPSLSKSTLNNIFLKNPNYKEQKKIGLLLSQIEVLITLQQRKLSLIKTLKRSFLSDLFFKTSTNSIVITLKQVTSIRGGYAFKSKEFTENGYPIIKIANISNNGEIKGPYSYTNNFNKKYILTKNDIVLAMSGATTGKIAKLRSSKAFLQNQRIGYFCKTNNIDYNYLYYLLISDQFKKQLKRITIAGAQPNVSSSDIENFRFSVLSSKNKQKKISDFLNKLDTKIRITNKKITIFSQLKRSLLNNMFI